jgi:hypothetical protein
MPDLKRDGWYRELAIRFGDQREERFFIEMTRSGTFMLAELEDPPEWTRLEYHKCSCCPLSPKMPFCPAAESLNNTLMRFRDHFSYEQVEAIAMDGANRRTAIEGTLQEVGSVFVQLAVFSSGCPVGKRLRPLLRDLRPFATNNELTRFLIGKILLKNRGNVEGAREDIKAQVEPLHEVFSRLWKRLDSQPPGGDAVQNSIVRMDAFTMNVSLQLDDILNELASDFGWEAEDDDGEDTTTISRNQLVEQGIDVDALLKAANPPAPPPKPSFMQRLKGLFGKPS